MDPTDDLERELNKLGAQNVSTKAETVSKLSEKPTQLLSANQSEKNALSVKSGDPSGTRQALVDSKGSSATKPGFG